MQITTLEALGLAAGAMFIAAGIVGKGRDAKPQPIGSRILAVTLGLVVIVINVALVVGARKESTQAAVAVVLVGALAAILWARRRAPAV
jgi:hypothetical protein